MPAVPPAVEDPHPNSLVEGAHAHQEAGVSGTGEITEGGSGQQVGLSRAQVEQGLSDVLFCARKGLLPLVSSQLRQPAHLLKLITLKGEVHPAEAPTFSNLACKPGLPTCRCLWRRTMQRTTSVFGASLTLCRQQKSGWWGTVDSPGRQG